jgi:hypothetical protein
MAKPIDLSLILCLATLPALAQSPADQMSALGPWLPLIAVIGLTPILLFVFRFIFSLDVDPSRNQGVDYIQLRLFAKVAEVIFMFGGSFSIVAGVDAFLRGENKGIGIATFGLAFTLFAGFAFNTHLWLDDQGMHFRSGIGKVQSIPWKALRYYDIQRVTGLNSGTTVYFRFHAADDTTLSISRTNYDMNRLLEKISANTDIHEQPYKQTSWFSD